MKAGIVATARFVTTGEMEAAVETLKGWGLVPVTGKNLYRRKGQFAGEDRERASDLQDMLDDPSIRLILCARGGYGTARIVRMLDFTGFLRSPKWIAGFSDLTVLHSWLQLHCGVESIHAPMALHFGGEKADPTGVESLRKILYGEQPEYTWDPHPLSIPGNCRGILTGGNLSVLYSLRGTPLDISPSHRVLFLEDLDEYLYHIDRMMVNLSLGGWFDSPAGVLVGGLTEMRDNEVPFGKDAESIVASHLAGKTYPVSFGFPAGHLRPNRALIFGRMVELETGKNFCRLKFLPPTREVVHG